ncbi:hypothetical protein EON65_43580 [archaeon]|nr:MAG: hypothetical protein EON65_43580 [archaeon]
MKEIGLTFFDDIDLLYYDNELLEDLKKLAPPLDFKKFIKAKDLTTFGLIPPQVGHAAAPKASSSLDGRDINYDFANDALSTARSGDVPGHVEIQAADEMSVLSSDSEISDASNKASSNTSAGTSSDQVDPMERQRQWQILQNEKDFAKRQRKIDSKLFS